MPRKKGSTNTTKTTSTGKVPIAQVRQENEKLKETLNKYQSYAYCYMCDAHKSRDHFYVSTDPMIKSGLTPICKQCARKLALRVDRNGEEHEPTKESVQLALKYLNKPFHNSLWNASIQESQNLITGKIKTNAWTAYIKNVAMGQYVTETYFDSDFYKEHIIYDDELSEEQKLKKQAGTENLDEFTKNKKDVTRLLGYDPFDSEAISDQPFLYSQLIGLIDAGGDENDDMMRNSSCISIVRGFLQAQKIDNTIAHLMSDIKNIQRNSATIKSLQDSKKNITGQITSLAAQSCISLKHNKNSKKGENTWTGKLKKIKDLDLRQGRMNGFDIETAKAMRQVMDLSNASILQQLRLDESEWADMVAEQREMVTKLQQDLDKYIEISRILLSENLDLRDYIKDHDVQADGYKYIDLQNLYSEFAAEDGGDSDETG